MMSSKRKISVLGTEYEILTGNADSYPALNECSGYTDTSVKRIILSDLSAEKQGDSPQADLDAYMRRVTRHEIIHAFLFESGLDNNTGDVMPWAVNEEIVDWIAIQAPKIAKAFEEAGCDG